LQLCVDEDVTQENNSKMIQKEILLNDIQNNGQGSNFYEFQQHIQVCDIYIIDLFNMIIFRIIQKMKSLLFMIMIIFIHKIFVCRNIY
jgi:hypothetical protein